MPYIGQIYRKAGEDGIWEIVEPPQGFGHESEWFLSKLGTKIITRVRVHDLENGSLWAPVRDA